MSNDRLIRLAQLRATISADKAKTEEGAKKLYKKYLDGLTPEGRKTTKKKPQDFYEGGGEGDEKSSGGFLSKVKKVLSKIKKNKTKAVAFAKKQGKQTKQMLSTIKQIALAPPKPEPDMVQKAKDQAVNIAKILFLAVNQAFPLPGTMPATLWATKAVNKLFKSNFSWAPKTWAKAGHKISADEADEFLNLFVDKLIELFEDPEVIEQVKAEIQKKTAEETNIDRNKLIRIAHANPELRAKLLPLIRGASK